MASVEMQTLQISSIYLTHVQPHCGAARHSRPDENVTEYRKESNELGPLLLLFRNSATK